MWQVPNLSQIKSKLLCWTLMCNIVTLCVVVRVQRAGGCPILYFGCWPSVTVHSFTRWFKQLNERYKVSGHAYYFYKPHGQGKTSGVSPSLALEKFKDGLKDPSMAFIYHCYNHYFCPIGYEEVPLKQEDAYRHVHTACSQAQYTHVYSRIYNSIQCLVWEQYLNSAGLLLLLFCLSSIQVYIDCTIVHPCMCRILAQ